MHRITGGEDGQTRLGVARQERGHRRPQRTRPAHLLGRHVRGEERELARGSEDDTGSLEGSAGGRTQPFPAVRADPDDVDRRMGCGGSPR